MSVPCIMCMHGLDYYFVAIEFLQWLARTYKLYNYLKKYTGYNNTYSYTKTIIIIMCFTHVGHLLKKQPKLMHLISWLGCMKNDWQQLGIQLGIPPYELQSIETTRPTQISRLTDVFNKWKEGAYSHYTFQNLLDCLKKMGQNANSPSVKAIYVNLKIHQAEYQNEEDYEEYTY